MIKEMKYRAKAIKYVAHLEEVRINAQVEMVRLQNQNMPMRLYRQKFSTVIRLYGGCIFKSVS